MLTQLLKELVGPAPGKAGGLAVMSSGAAGAALFVKCGYQAAGEELQALSQLAQEDGVVFERYLAARRAGRDSSSLLIPATEIPLRAAELSLNLLEQYPGAREECPRPMLADLDAGGFLLEAACRGSLRLTYTNLRLLSSRWAEGEARADRLKSRLLERDTFAGLFRSTCSIAVVGISNEEEKPAYYVPAYLRDRGYRIWGVHPRRASTLAERTVSELRALRTQVDMVLLFRRSEKVPEHLNDILDATPRAVWMQEGIQNDSVARVLRAHGIEVVSDRCALLEHSKLGYTVSG